MPNSPIAYTGFAAMLATVAFVFWTGGRLERFTAAIAGAGWVLVGLVQSDDARQVPWASFAVDALTEVVFVVVAARSGRSWAAFLAAFQLLNLSSYVAFALDSQLFHRAFVTLSYLWSVGILASLGVGGWSARIRLRGSDARSRPARA